MSGGGDAGLGGTAGVSGAGGAPPLYTLSIVLEGTGEGTVTSLPAGIDCGATCSATFPAGGVWLTHAAEHGSAYGGWQTCDDVSGTDCYVVLDSDRTVTARFDHCGASSIDADRFVNVEFGQNDPAYGGGEGLCAYKSISYALAQSSGVVRVAGGNYDEAEEFPIVLGGTQSLICDPFSVIRATANSGSTLVFFEGTRNSLTNCSIDLLGFPGIALYVGSDGEHGVAGTHFRNGNTGIHVAAGVERLIVIASTFTNNAYGISWDTGSRGSILGSTFTGNSSASVRCRQATDPITGSSNSLESCVDCQSCPFN